MVDVVISPTQATIDLAPSSLVVEIGKGPTGPGLPPGGAVGVFPVKKTTTDYDFEFKPTGAVGLALLAMSALTAGSLLLGNGTGAPTELATTSYGRSFIGLADATAGRNALELGPTHSPTFAGLTSTDTIWATNGVIQTIVSYGGSTGNIGTNSSHALALITAGSERVNISTGGVTTFYGSAPGTPGAGEVRIGGGKLWSADNLISYGSILCTPPGAHGRLILGANDAGSAGYIDTNGNGSQINWRFGGNITVAHAFEIIPSTAVGGAAFTTPVLTITNTGAATFTGIVYAGAAGNGTGGNYRNIDDGGTVRWLTGILGPVGARNWSLYDVVNSAERVSIDATTGAAMFNGLLRVNGDSGLASYGVLGSLGVSGITATHYTGDGTGYTWRVAYRTGSVTTTLMSIDDAVRSLSVAGSVPGTPSAGMVLIGGGRVAADTGFYVGANPQPVSTVSFINVNGSSTADLLTVADNEMWQLDIGNATDGYQVHAVFGKPSASSGAVMPTNDNTHANLTVALVGNILRISNGIGSTRTMIYTLTKLR